MTEKDRDNTETLSTLSQVLAKEDNRIYVYVSRLQEDEEEDTGVWIDIPSHYPDWFIDGYPCYCQIKKDIKTEEDFSKDSNALTDFEYKEPLSDEDFNSFMQTFLNG